MAGCTRAVILSSCSPAPEKSLDQKMTAPHTERYERRLFPPEQSLANDKIDRLTIDIFGVGSMPNVPEGEKDNASAGFPTEAFVVSTFICCGTCGIQPPRSSC